MYQNGQPKPKRILYFSSKCPHCDEFSQELNRSGMSSTFQQICIDYKNDPFTGKPITIPRFLKKVPTLYINDQQNSRAKVYAGQQAFEWLRTRGNTERMPNANEGLNQILPPTRRTENGKPVNEGLMDVGEFGIGSSNVNNSFSDIPMNGDPNLSVSRDTIRHGQLGRNINAINNKSSDQKSLPPVISCSKLNSDDLMKQVQQKQQKYGLG